MKTSALSKSNFRQWVVLFLATATIITSFTWLVWRWRQEARGDIKPPIYLYCTKCLSVYQPMNRLGGEHPRECDKCGQKAAWYAVQCKACGEIFGYITMIEQQGQMVRVQPVCPNCGSGNYEIYNPDKREKKQAAE